MSKRKNILLVIARNGKAVDIEIDQKVFIDYIFQTDSSVNTRMTALSELVYEVSNSQMRIYHPTKGFDMKDFDLVVFKGWANEPERAVAAAAYLRKHQIKYIDDTIPNIGVSKIACSFVRAAQNIPQPAVIFGQPKDVLDALKSANSIIKPPFIVKDINGKKGRDNYLCQTVEDVEKIFTQNVQIEFVVQQYIPNDGDYRIIVLGGEAKLVIHRTAVSGSHLNNTSAGGQAELADINTISTESLKDVLKAVEVERLYVAGADLIIDKYTGQHYILEINRSPQLHTGSFVPEKMKAYAEYLVKLLESKG